MGAFFESPASTERQTERAISAGCSLRAHPPERHLQIVMN